jgi:hypothetical protein
MTNTAFITALAVEHVRAWARFDALDTASDERTDAITNAELAAEAITLALASVRAESLDALRPKVAAFRRIAGSNPSPSLFADLSANERALGDALLRDLVAIL